MDFFTTWTDRCPGRRRLAPPKPGKDVASPEKLANVLLSPNELDVKTIRVRLFARESVCERVSVATLVASTRAIIIGSAVYPRRTD